MKYEFIFKVKECPSQGYKTRYRCVVDSLRYDSQRAAYLKLAKAHPEWDYVILINELDDLGNFIKVIQ